MKYTFEINMPIKEASISDKDDVAPLIALFRVELKVYKYKQSSEDLEDAKGEFEEYIQKDYPIFIYKEDDIVMGYIVCRVEESVVWVEALYVNPEYRRKGIASKLYDTAEQLAKSFGEASLYNYVHPNNDNMIMFLRSKGYHVLNMIEIRKKYNGEILKEKIQIRNNVFDY